jgi:UrcA family protein
MRILTASLFAALGLLLGASSASAGGCGAYAGNAPVIANENVTVGAPQMQYGPQRFDTQAVSLSQAVGFADLDLCTDAGADALKDRIRKIARNMCRSFAMRGADFIPAYPSCYTSTIANVMPRADAAIAAAREGRYYSGMR